MTDHQLRRKHAGLDFTAKTMTIFEMRRRGWTPSEIEAVIFHEATGWDLESLDVDEFPYSYGCLEHEAEEIQEDCEAYRIIAGLMQRLLLTPCEGCGHPWGEHDRLKQEQPCVNRMRPVAPFDCPCPSFTRPADFSEPTFTVPGPLFDERPGTREGPMICCHDDRWPR